MKSLTVCVALSFIFCILFTVAVLALTVIGYTVPDMLIQYFFTTFGLELGASAAIKITKHVINRKEIENTVKDIKKNNLELTKEDLKPSEVDYMNYDEGGTYG